MPDVSVHAFDKLLRSEQLLGQTRTDRSGRYVIAYDPSRLAATVSLVVRAYDGSGKLLGESPVVFRPAAQAHVNVVVGGTTYLGYSQYEELTRTLGASLDGAAVGTLTAEDVTFLSSATGSDPQQVQAYADANRLGPSLGVQPEVVFALLEQGLTTDEIAQGTAGSTFVRDTLTTAIAANIVPSMSSTGIDAAVATLTKAAVSAALAPAATGHVNVGTILSTSGVGAALLQSALQVFADPTVVPSDAWATIRSQAGSSNAAAVDKLELTLQLGVLTHNHAPLVAYLLGLTGTQQVSSLSDLARLTRDDWYAMLSQVQAGQPIGVPGDVPGSSDTERLWTYATTLARAVEEAFPSAVLMARLSGASPSSVNTDAVRFLGQSPTFDIVGTSIPAYLKANPSSTNGLSNVPALTTALEGWQRLARVTPRIDEVLGLSAAGLTSAQSIARMGWGAFSDAFAPTLGAERADIVFGNASHAAQTAFALYGRFNPPMNFPWMGALSWLDPRELTKTFVAQGLPDYASLFGSLDACQCADCRSITSPAAYLVDLLQFLGGPESAGQKGLRFRRPDLFATDLSCANTNTAMPYLDLVNEVLENTVAPQNAPWPQTPANASSDELAAQPVSVNLAAYGALATASFPWTLPFDLGLEEARIYLTHLGVSLPDLAETFRASPATAAAARLDLTATDLTILASTAPSTSAPPTQVDQYLVHAGLSYDELLDVLWTDFVNPQRQIEVTLPPGDCSLSSATITGMSAAVDAAIARFTRLRRKLGWTAVQLDVALRAFGTTATAPMPVQPLGDAMALAASTGIDVVEMMSWWAPSPDTKAQRDGTVSFYDSVFQNKTVLDPNTPGGDFGAFTVDASGKLTSQSPGTWFDHLAAFGAALGLSVADVLLIAQGRAGLVPAGTAGWPVDIAPTDLLSNGNGSQLGNIGQAFRVASLARGLGLSIRDFQVLRALTTVDPFASTTNARSFLAVRDAVRASPFSIEETGEILLGIAPAPGSALLASDAATVLVQDIRTSYAGLVAQYAAVPDLTGDRLRKALAAAVAQATPGDLDAVLAVVAGTSPLNASDQLSKLHGVLDSVLGASAVTTLGATLAALPLSPAADRYDAVSFPLLGVLLATQSRNMIVQTVAAATKADVAATRVLLTQAIGSTGTNPGLMAMDDLLAAAAATDPSGDPTKSLQAALATALPTLGLVAKAALIVSRFRLSIDELKFTLATGTTPMFVGRDAQVGWLDLNSLPGTPPPLPGPDLTRWLAEVATFAFRDRFAVAGSGALALVANASSLATFTSTLSSLTGWSTTDVQALVESPGIGLAATELASGAALGVLTRCADALARLGASAAQAIGWVASPSASAAAIKSAAKSKYPTPSDWYAVAKPLRDALRVQQRDALVAWLIGTGSFANSDQLFDNYLIDVEMGSCAQTSRIKQAIGSTQLFIQRILLNLEPGLIILGSQAAQWGAWMGRYRVWQANREVLLYPENWLDPTLRDDTTPFFQDLMNELGRASPTSATCEVAYRNYLEKLEDVARLLVVATYQDTSTSVVHVLARTSGQTPRYYYRSYQSTPYASWTPWMAVPLDITDDSILLVVWNRRLHVLWGVYTAPTSGATPPLTYPQPTDDLSTLAQPKSLDIRIAWSELRDGAWSPKRVTVESYNTQDFSIDAEDPEAARQQLHLTVRVVTDDAGGEALSVGLGWQGPHVTHARPSFRFPACGSEPVKDGFDQFGPTPPKNLEYLGQWLVNQPGGALYLDTSLARGRELFQQSPSTVSVVLERVSDDLQASAPFFYQDESRCFFVQPATSYVRWQTNGNVHPSQLGQVSSQVPYVVAGDAPPVRGAPAASAGSEHWVFPAQSSGGTATTVANMYTVSRGTILGQTAASGRTTYKPGSRSPIVVVDKFSPRHGVSTFDFEPFYHPYVCEALGRLDRFGLDGLLSWRFQEQLRPPPLGPQVQLLDNDFFYSTYAPTNLVDKPYPQDDFDVRPQGACSIYNWEVFFHAPLLIAQKLTTNQRFDEAKTWLEYIFDPTDTNRELGSPARYWKFKKFFQDASTGGVPASVAELVSLLSGDPSSPAAQSFHAQVAAYKQDPFNPFAIARLRTAAFQKATVMAYIDNLIAWGDNLFAQNTLESINEAILMYVLASEILGPRPLQIEPPSTPLDAKTYDDIATNANLGSLSDPLVALENAIPGSLTNYPPTNNAPSPQALFFCVPGNDQLLSRWDTVADRLYKIRHCMNIQGQVEQLPLFEPPINPALLVRAAASGQDLTSILSDLATPLPFYRFQTMAQKASELAGEVRSLGQALLGALEKSDAEYLALLRANQEVSVQKSVLIAKTSSAAEAQSSIVALQKSQEIAKARNDYYSGLLAAGYLATENSQLKELGEASTSQESAGLLQLAAGLAGAFPSFSEGVAGAGGTPEVTMSIGGGNLAAPIQGLAAQTASDAAKNSTQASNDAASASYTRRTAEWTFQASLASLDETQIGLQMDAANKRLDVANQDVLTQELQVQDAQDVRDFLQSKFTDQQLYDWMVRQVSSTYFQAYQLAYDLAKRAERTFHREIGDEADPNAIAYIQFGYWDSLAQGLLAGERLAVDLRRMEAAYLEQNRRELEIMKHVSLLELDPVALVQLKQGGTCFVSLPETLFDADFPGHYMRRIKSVAVTIPCEVGPYTSVNCTLTLTRSSVRWSPSTSAAYPRAAAPAQDKRFSDSVGATEAIVTSSGQSDAGLFEANLRDERYLPFEGAGVISVWKIDLPGSSNGFDTTSVTDVILHVRYTARDGGDALRTLASGAAPLMPSPAAARPPTRLFLASQDFSDAFYRFMNPDPSQTGQYFDLDFSDARFPYHRPGGALGIQQVRVFIVPAAAGTSAAGLAATLLPPPPPNPLPAPPTASPPTVAFGTASDLPQGVLVASFTATGPTGHWTLMFAESQLGAFGASSGGHTRLNPAGIAEIGFLCTYG